MSVVFAKIQMRRGTAAQWAAANPVLAQGELAFETDTGLTKVGDGATAYASLPAYATYDQMLAAKEALDEAALDVAAVEASRVAAAGSAATATTKATEAAGSAAAALTSAQSADAKANQAEQARIDALAASGIAVTKADEIVASAQAAAADASAADADRIAAEVARTGAEAAQAIAQGAAAGALASEVAADLSADLAAGSAAQSLAIYGSVEAQQAAVVAAQAQASLAAGFAASAASVMQQDLSGVTAQALHRSPNAVTAMFLYDTSKDSDGGAWTEKCQHTSWWNETLAGKWLGAVGGEFMARAQGATLGPNVVANPTLDQNATGFSVFSGATIVSEGGRGRLTGSGTQFCGVFADFSDPASLTANVLYEMSFDVYAGTYTGTIGISSDGQDPITSYASVQGGFTRYTAYMVPGVFINGSNGRRLRIRFESAHTAGQFVFIDNVSYRRVTAITAQSGDYFQLATDGRFYRLWRNRFSWTEDFTNAAWNKTNGSVTMNGVEGLFIPTANAGTHSIGQGRDATTHEQTMTVEVKAAGYTKVALVETVNTGGQSRVVDLTNGSFVGTHGGGTIVTPLADGWYRISWHSTGFSQFNSNWAVYPIPDSGVNTGANIFQQTWTADGVSGIRIRFPQIEYAAAFTSYERKVADQITSEVFRGNKRDFPRLAGIVAEATSVNIYDLTEPGRPMWMRIARTNDNAFGLLPGSGASFSGLCALNGILGVTNNFSFGAFVLIDFPKDGGRALRANETTDANNRTYGFYEGGIANRHVSAGRMDRRFVTFSSDVTNAVAMTVLPDAPVDPVTGLRVPTIAVATGGGLSFIRHDGTVAAITDSFYSQYSEVVFERRGSIVARHSSGSPFFTRLTRYFRVPQANLAITAGAVGANGYSINVSLMRMLNSGGSYKLLPNLFRAEGSVSLYREDVANGVRSLVATLSPTFNTGWMAGDVRRCYLADTGIGNLIAGASLFSDLFTPDRVLTSSTSWRPVIATASVTGGVLEIRHDHVNSPTGRVVSAADLVEPGKTYRCRWTVESLVGNATGSVVCLAQDSSGNGGVSSGAIVGVGSFEAVIQVPLSATGRRIAIYANGGTSAGAVAGVRISAFTVEEIVSDRSFRGAGALVAGTLTRAQLASGTSLVGFSGFSAANYLREPFSADLDFGTGEWTGSAWLNIPATLPASSFPTIGAEIFAGSLPATVANPGSNLAIGNVTAGKAYRVTVTTSANPGTIGASFRINGSGGNLSPSGGVGGTFVGTLTHYFVATSSGSFSLNSDNTGTNMTLSAVSLMEVAPALAFDRAAASGPALRLGVQPNGRLLAEAFDGTTARTVTTSASYNTAQWLKARVNYTTDGTLAILVNGREVAASRGAPLLTLNNASAVLTIGNSFALDAPFPGSIALLKLGATVPTPEQATFMYEQEKQLFRAGALCVLPDSGSLVDMAYDDVTDRWVAVSAANESYWTGLVRNSVQAVPAGSFSRVVAGSGLELAARTGTNPGVDVTIPAYGLREELVRRAEAAARLSRELVAFDFVGGFTANTTNGSAAITSVAGLTYPGSLIGARVSGAGIPANTRIVGVSGTTIYLSAAATATATGVSVSFLDFNLPVAFEARAVLSAGALRREGSTADFTRLYDGFLETIRFAVAPGATAWVQIQATRGTMQ